MSEFVTCYVGECMSKGGPDTRRFESAQNPNAKPHNMYTMMHMRYMIPLLLGEEPYSENLRPAEFFTPDKVRTLASRVTVNGEPIAESHEINNQNYLEVVNKISLELTRGLDPWGPTLGMVDKDNNPIALEWEHSQFEPIVLPEVAEPKKMGRFKTFLHKLGFFNKEFAEIEEQTKEYNRYKKSVTMREEYVENCQKQRDASGLFSSMNEIESRYASRGGDLSKPDEMLKVTYSDITRDAPIKTTSTVKEQEINAPSLDASR